MKLLSLIAAIFMAATVQAQQQGVPDYCRYVQEQAQAQRDLLRTPSLVVETIQPATGTAPQMVIGATESLQGLREAKLTETVGNATCTLYGANTEAQLHILYALPSIEKQVLTHRLDLIQDASNQLDGLIIENQKIVDAHNLTKPALYTLQEAKVRLDLSRTEALTGLTTPYVPELSKTPLRELVDTKMGAESRFEQATTKLEKQSSWDIRLEGGEHHQISSVSAGQSSGGLYGSFSVTYNFGRHAADRHFDNSGAAYLSWKTTQYDDVSQETKILRQQILDTIKIQQGQLSILTMHQSQIDENLATVQNVQSSAALAFKTQLQADRIVLGVDIQDVQYRIAALEQYMADNF